LGAGFLGAALAPFFFVVVAWPVVSIRCVPPTRWVALGALPPPAIGPDGAVRLPDCWAFATMTPPTSAAAVASGLASTFIETSRDVPRNYRSARVPPFDFRRRATLTWNTVLSRRVPLQGCPDLIPAPLRAPFVGPALRLLAGMPPFPANSRRRYRTVRGLELANVIGRNTLILAAHSGCRRGCRAAV
jgi:hypothetical protein